ncbi:oxo-acid lyase [Salmonella enterica subsp. enterica]|nr:oxo-acid lyase [Salmonella enterica subsp. enterica]
MSSPTGTPGLVKISTGLAVAARAGRHRIHRNGDCATQKHYGRQLHKYFPMGGPPVATSIKRSS